jgi:SAM-dependent methyltransferase
VDLRCDIRTGLPLETDSIDCIASIHVLQDLPYFDIAPALGELKRVLKPGGVLRVAVPDLDKALCAYLAGDSAYAAQQCCGAQAASGPQLALDAWLRRPFISAIRETRRVLRAARTEGMIAACCIEAARGLPWVLRNRCVAPAEVEAMCRQIEESGY